MTTQKQPSTTEQGFVVVPSNLIYSRGPGQDGKIYLDKEEALERAARLSRMKPTSLMVVPYKPDQGG
jgi:hypothetical protein